MESSFCPKGFFCLDSNTLILITGLVSLFFIYITISKKQEFNKMVDYKELQNEKIYMLDRYAKNLNHNYKRKLEQPMPHHKRSPTIKVNYKRPPPQRTIVIKKNNRKEEEFGGDVIVKNNVYVIPPTNQQTTLVNKEYERLINPLLPPERSYTPTYSVPINVPTRGYTANYQQVGVLTSTSDNVVSGEPRILPLYGRPQWSGSSKWNFYTSTDQYNSLKLPIYYKSKDCQDSIGCDELYDGDIVTIPQYANKNFKATIYRLDSPQYLPVVN